MALLGWWKRRGASGSTEERAALAAEAAGDYVEAARRWALCERGDKVAEMHLLRAERAQGDAARQAALRDALRWAPADSAPGAEARRKLAAALTASAQRGALATAADRELVREAAKLLEDVGDLAAAGAAWELIGEDDDAARAYQRGGHVDKLEQALARDERKAQRARRLREALDEYRLHDGSGDRESARAALVQAIELADDKSEVTRLLETLDQKRLAGGRVRLVARGQAPLLVVSRRLTMGRDPSCDLPVAAAGVSRVHAEVVVEASAFVLRDAGSKNGTRIAGTPIAERFPLDAEVVVALGDHVEVALSPRPGLVRVGLHRGPGRADTLVLLADGQALQLTELGLPATLRFDGGRPLLAPEPGKILRLGGQRVARGVVQLVVGDVVAIDEHSVEVLAP